MTTARIPFDANEEKRILGLGQWMMAVAIIHFLLGAVVVLLSCFGCFGAVQMISQGLTGIFAAVRVFFALLSGPILIIQGVLLLKAKKSFDTVVATDQNDQAELASAFGQVRVFFMIEVAYGVIQLCLSMVDIVTPIIARFM